jgi:hypothetical protein
MPTLAQHRLDGLEPRPDEPTGCLDEPPPGPDERPRGRSMKPDRSFSKILYNTSRIVCKRACGRRRCPGGTPVRGRGRQPGMDGRTRDDPPLRNRRSSLSGSRRLRNGALSLLVINRVEGPIDGNL